MNVVRALTLRHLKSNKRRTLVTICGTIVSVAMITAVLMIVASFMQMFQQSVIEQTGDWQVQFTDMPAQNIPLVAENDDTAFYTVKSFTGWARLPESADPRRQAMVLDGYSPESFAKLPLTMVEGVYPRNGHELLVSQNFIETARLDWQVGKTIVLDKGDYWDVSGGEPKRLTFDNGMLGRSADEDPPQWQSSGSETYTIVGIAQMGTEMEQAWMNSYTGLCGLDVGDLGDEELVTVQQKVAKINGDLYERGNALGKELGAANVRFNNQLLIYHGVVKDNGFRRSLITIVAILAMVILIGSVSLIYNAFAISLTERSRMLGLLASVGATRRQKMGSVFFEAAYIGVIAIPLGLVCGYAGISITFKCLEGTLKRLLGMQTAVQVSLPIWAIVGAVIFTAVVLAVSAFIPARRAARISPIEAIRSTQDIKISRRQVKTSPLTGKIFGFEAQLGLKNIKRNRSRYLASLFSLIISVILFLSAATFTEYMSHSFEMTQMSLQYDVVASANTNDIAGREQWIADIRNQHYSDYVGFGQYRTFRTHIPAEVAVEESAEGPIIYSGDNYEMDVSICFVDEAYLRQFALEAGIDAELLLSDNLRGIALTPITVRQGYTFNEISLLKGQTAVLDLDDGQSGQLEIVATTSHMPMYLPGYLDGAEPLYVITAMQAGDAWMRTYGQNLSRVEAWIQSRQSTLLYNDLVDLSHQYTAARMSVVDINGTMETQNQLQAMMAVFIYGFITLIVLVCAANIFNTISTGVALRTREFAMLRSVGITPGKFNKMVCYESLFYGIKALAYGLPISLALAALMYRSIDDNFGFAFYIPVWAYVTAIIGTLLLVGITMAYAIGQIKRINLIDGLKNENL